jgi:hypothetical protein
MPIDPRLHRIVAAQPYPLLFATISGAHLYGFPSPDSDFDLRGAHVSPLDAVVGLDGRDNCKAGRAGQGSGSFRRPIQFSENRRNAMFHYGERVPQLISFSSVALRLSCRARFWD